MYIYTLYLQGLEPRPSAFPALLSPRPPGSSGKHKARADYYHYSLLLLLLLSLYMGGRRPRAPGALQKVLLDLEPFSRCSRCRFHCQIQMRIEQIKKCQ